MTIQKYLCLPSERQIKTHIRRKDKCRKYFIPWSVENKCRPSRRLLNWYPPSVKDDFLKSVSDTEQLFLLPQLPVSSNIVGQGSLGDDVQMLHLLSKANLCTLHTERLNKLKCQGLEQTKVYCRVKQRRMGGLCSKLNSQTLMVLEEEFV